jgi:O-antigen/teichoic acid export membrane protein
MKPLARKPRDRRPGSRLTVASGAATIMSGQLATYALGFPASIVIARALGAEGRGLYYLPVIAATTCVSLCNLSIENANTVLVSERKYSLPQVARNASLMACVLGPLAVALMLALWPVLHTTVLHGVAFADYVIAVATIPFSLHLLWLSNVFLLGRRPGRSQAALLAGAAVQLAGVAIGYAGGFLGVTQVLVLYAAMVVVPWLLLVWWSARVAPVRPLLDRTLARAVTGLGLKLHFGLISSFLLLRFDVFLVNLYRDPTDVGVYSVAVLFAELAWFLTGPLSQAILPFQAELSAHHASPLAFKAARFNVAVVVALSAVFAATLWFLLPRLYGAQFGNAYPALLLLLPGIAGVSLARPLMPVVTRLGRPLLYSAMLLVAFLLNTAINVALIPAIGINGASIASSVAYVALATASAAWVLRAGGLTAREALVPKRSDIATAHAALSDLRARVAARA